MQKILILGAGLSASTLIKYLLDKSTEYNWKITIGDVDLKKAELKAGGHPNSRALRMDINNINQINKHISANDVVVSMLPARFHVDIARLCLANKKHFITASYVSQEIRDLKDEVKKNRIIFANELGVDPGIDHMSAMRIIDRIKMDGGKLLSFISTCGGLVAPEYDNNPWNYKFTWNPRNVIMAGQSTARFIWNGRYKHVPYHRLFSRIQTTRIPGAGGFEYYANRDSLCYREDYNLHNIPTMYRGTLRRPGFCKAWNILVLLGCTDDSYKVENIAEMTWRDFMNSFLQYDPDNSVEDKLAEYAGIERNDEIMQKLEWLGIFEDKKIGLKEGTPAQVLQFILEKKWKLDPDDKDMIVMQHNFVYEINNQKKEIVSSLVVRGLDNAHTAMSITVGLPLGIATKLVMTGKITKPGVHIPVSPDYYVPILNELKEFGINFVEEEKSC